MSPTKTDDREQWRARILRALEELQPHDPLQETTQRSEERLDGAGAAE